MKNILLCCIVVGIKITSNEVSFQQTVDQAMKHLKDNLPATLQENLKAAVCPYLVLEVKRETLMQDALAQIQLKRKDLKKPLKIKFVGGGEQVRHYY